ncbi:MAG: hypothetical protein FD168_1192 [Desulfobulbaceae bacterium]|nr:MAG: hypothetical protein FD168_1192 [Desulfobulbaceae bacterium]
MRTFLQNTQEGGGLYWHAERIYHAILATIHRHSEEQIYRYEPCTFNTFSAACTT